MNTKIPGSVSDMLDIANSLEDMDNPETSPTAPTAPSTQTLDSETLRPFKTVADNYASNQTDEQNTVPPGPASAPLSTNPTVYSINEDMENFESRLDELLAEPKMSEEKKQATNDELVTLLNNILVEVKDPDVSKDQRTTLLNKFLSKMSEYQTALDDPTKNQNVGDDLRTALETINKAFDTYYDPSNPDWMTQSGVKTASSADKTLEDQANEGLATFQAMLDKATKMMNV